MAEAVGLAASVIGIIDLSAKVAVLCLQYSTAVGHARADITRLRSRLDDLGTTLQGVQRLLDNRNHQALATSRKLADSLDGCTSELVQLQSRLAPGKARKAMRRFGLRALKWPFDSKELSDIVSNLERYEQTITLGLQIDQTTILLDIQQRIEDVSLQPKETASMARKACFSLPFERDPDFVDRPDIMTWIGERYTSPVGRMALVGMGGFGKSQLAIQFAHHVRDTSPHTSVFWVHASSKPRFEEAYRSIADNLRLPRREDPSVDILGLVRDWLQREEAGPWLMVLDNADDVNLFYPNSNASRDRAAHHPVDENPAALGMQRSLAVFLPKRRNGIILITSRSMDVAEKLTGSHKAIYRIVAMDHAQALQLFRNKLEGDMDRNAASDLVPALDYIPLAITQAAAYINRRAPRISVKAYLEAIRESEKKKGSLLNSDAGDLRRDETVSNSVVTTWQVTLDQIRRERPSAADLLSFMSFFNPQGIPEFVLRDYKHDLADNLKVVKDNKDNDEFEDDLDVLRGYSLVSVTAKRDVCEMHPLVQFCTRVWLSMVDNTDRWQRLFLWAMSRHFPDGGFKTWPTCQMLLPHIDSILVEVPQEKDMESWAALLTHCARYMVFTGRYEAAEILSKRAVKTRMRVLGEEDPGTLSSMTNLASAFDSQGRWKEAEELEVQVMETTKRLFGEEHTNTLASMSNLACTLWSQGRWKEAEELQAKELGICSRVLGGEHPDTLYCMASLASSIRSQGRWKEAEELEVQVIERMKRVLGEEHPDTLTGIANLASTFSNQGRWKEAEELDAKVLGISSRVLGEEHPHTLQRMGNLAFDWNHQGRSEDALALLRKCVMLQKRVLGADHPDAVFRAEVLAKWERVNNLS